MLQICTVCIFVVDDVVNVAVAVVVNAVVNVDVYFVGGVFVHEPQ